MICSDFIKYKKEGRKITMLTCYDYPTAKILNSSPVDSILVGDSGAMAVHGYPSTIHADTPMMQAHVKAVRRGAPDKFIIGDMPFLSFRKGKKRAMDCVEILMRAGANAVKLEGVDGHEEVIERIVKSDIPVMGHIGLTPQSIEKLGGYKVQGKDTECAEKLVADAKKLEDLGCFAIVVECVPSKLGWQISQALNIPTIGIGAGVCADGQVLVINDMLGMAGDVNPKFVRKYADLSGHIKKAVDNYCSDIRSGKFPSENESY